MKKTLREQRLELLKQLESIRVMEKFEQKEARFAKFELLKKRDPCDIKIAGLDSWHFRNSLSASSLETFEDYRKLCNTFESALDQLRYYYRSHNHENLIREVMPHIENDNHLISALLNCNEFKKI